MPTSKPRSEPLGFRWSAKDGGAAAPREAGSVEVLEVWPPWTEQRGRGQVGSGAAGKPAQKWTQRVGWAPTSAPRPPQPLSTGTGCACIERQALQDGAERPDSAPMCGPRPVRPPDLGVPLGGYFPAARLSRCPPCVERVPCGNQGRPARAGPPSERPDDQHPGSSLHPAEDLQPHLEVRPGAPAPCRHDQQFTQC